MRRHTKIRNQKVEPPPEAALLDRGCLPSPPREGGETYGAEGGARRGRPHCRRSPLKRPTARSSPLPAPPCLPGWRGLRHTLLRGVAERGRAWSAARGRQPSVRSAAQRSAAQHAREPHTFFARRCSSRRGRSLMSFFHAMALAARAFAEPLAQMAKRGRADLYFVDCDVTKMFATHLQRLFGGFRSRLDAAWQLF